MTNVSYLVLRRLRAPLIFIICVYTFCTVGLSLMPGVDGAGNPTPGMGLFHAFYVISFTGTTIGFGEIPVPFSGAQRLWMILSIYLSVFGWSYAVVTVISLIQEPAFRETVRAGRFAQRVLRLHEPFYIVCGCGETGTVVCHGLDRLNLRFIVLEQDRQRLEELRLEEFRHDPPMLVADAAQPATLTAAGLLSPHCRGVVALAQADETNQAIAVNVRLLRPGVPVLARIRDPDMDTHLGVFGDDIVINPFERFADHLASALVAPERFRLRQILTGLPGAPLPERHRPPHGHWIMCGYGRFGHAVVARLKAAGLTVSVVDKTNYVSGEVAVKGRGTEPGTLEAAGIGRAVGIVVGNKEDQRNLAIAVLARELKPGIFVVTRQNQRGNTALFDAFEEDLCMEPSRLVAEEFLSVITTPLLARYLELIPELDEERCAALSDKLELLDPGYVPEIWSLAVRDEAAVAIRRTIEDGGTVRLDDLLHHPVHRKWSIRVLPLLLMRDNRAVPLPDPATEVALGDALLFAGSPAGRRHLMLSVGNENVLTYVRIGRDSGGGWIWRRLARRGEAGRRPSGPHVGAPADPPPTRPSPPR